MAEARLVLDADKREGTVNAPLDGREGCNCPAAEGLQGGQGGDVCMLAHEST